MSKPMINFYGLGPESGYATGVCADCLLAYGVPPEAVNWIPYYEDGPEIYCYPLECRRCHTDFAQPNECDGDCDSQCAVAMDRAVMNAEGVRDAQREEG